METNATESRYYCRSGKYRRHAAILMVLDGIMRTFNAGKHGKSFKSYCYPSQDKIIDLLSKYHGIECSRRTINYDLKELEDGTSPLGRGITRIQRHCKGDNGAMVCHSTAYYIAKQACMRLFRQVCRLKTLVFTRVQSIAQYMNYVHKDLVESADAYGFQPLFNDYGGISPPVEP